LRSRLFSLAVAGLAALAMANSASAASILSFGINIGTKTATASGGVTTLTTSSLVPGSLTSNIVNISTLGNQTVIPPGSAIAKETFVGVQSAGAAQQVGPVIFQLFSGTITYIDNVNPAINYLTITFTNGLLRGTQGGLTANLIGDNSIGGSVTFTSTDPRVTPFINDPVRQFNLTLTGLNIPFGITGTGATATVSGFTSTNESGAVSSVPIPEPASVVMASTAVLAGLGCFGYRRSRSKSL
jgi:hypothetical protein